MSPPDGGSTLTLNDAQAAEDKMRAALGLAPDKAQSSRQISQESRPGAKRGSEASPTVVTVRRPLDASGSLRARLVTIQSAFEAERSERIAAQRTLADAQTLIQQLQTKLAHTEIAAAEALAVERQALLAVQLQLQDLTPSALPSHPEPAGKKRRGRPPGQDRRLAAEAPEPEPVQWWLPSYKASKNKRRSHT